MISIKATAPFQVMLGIPLLEGTSPASCFPRIAFGYDAVCYSYIWSEVRAIDPKLQGIFASAIFGNLRKHIYLNYAGVCC
jgi:hypothetical protein